MGATVPHGAVPQFPDRLSNKGKKKTSREKRALELAAETGEGNDLIDKLIATYKMTEFSAKKVCKHGARVMKAWQDCETEEKVMEILKNPDEHINITTPKKRQPKKKKEEIILKSHLLKSAKLPKSQLVIEFENEGDVDSDNDTQMNTNSSNRNTRRNRSNTTDSSRSSHRSSNTNSTSISSSRPSTPWQSGSNVSLHAKSKSNTETETIETYQNYLKYGDRIIVTVAAYNDEQRDQIEVATVRKTWWVKGERMVAVTINSEEGQWILHEYHLDDVSTVLFSPSDRVRYKGTLHQILRIRMDAVLELEDLTRSLGIDTPKKQIDFYSTNENIHERVHYSDVQFVEADRSPLLTCKTLGKIWKIGLNDLPNKKMMVAALLMDLSIRDRRELIDSGVLHREFGRKLTGLAQAARADQKCQEHEVSITGTWGTSTIALDGYNKNTIAKCRSLENKVDGKLLEKAQVHLVSQPTRLKANNRIYDTLPDCRDLHELAEEVGVRVPDQQESNYIISGAARTCKAALKYGLEALQDDEDFFRDRAEHVYEREDRKLQLDVFGQIGLVDGYKNDGKKIEGAPPSACLIHMHIPHHEHNQLRHSYLVLAAIHDGIVECKNASDASGT